MQDRPVVVITGGGTGIGAAVAHEMASSHQVVICGRRREPLERVAAATGALVVQADIGVQGDAERCVDRAIRTFGHLDALVLNAGIARPGVFADTSVKDWHETLEVNLTGPFYVARAAMPHLIERKGAIVAVASVAALVAPPALSAYAVSKAGLVTMMQGIVRDHGAAGVRANVVCPGWIRTEMADWELQVAANAKGISLEQMYAEATRHVPAGRAASPREAAAPIAWLLSTAASYVNGAVLTVDGGSTVVDAGSLSL
jgi:NAD(P)-dependent dehydrogenase (short-subunit alcohol dehydrogenase family)